MSNRRLHKKQQKELNLACRKLNDKYVATEVSWNDNSRTQGSSFGSNITDARLKGKDGQDFVVVRPKNFDEKIGGVKASEVALLVTQDNKLVPITLQDYLNKFPEFSRYAGNDQGGGLLSDRDSKVGIRFQAVFLPVQKQPDGEKKIEFFPETFNYQTDSRDDPKNVVLLCTSQGTFVQQDGPGNQPQFVHTWNKATERWENRFLEALETRHGVSMGQVETQEERQEAVSTGKAVSTVIGTKAMGIGFNRLMTIQVPLRQRGRSRDRCHELDDEDEGEEECFSYQTKKRKRSLRRDRSRERDRSLRRDRSRSRESQSRAHAARVSFGSGGGLMTRLGVVPVRDDTCAITITVQFYFAVDHGRSICEDDITAAIAVCEEGYSGCDFSSQLQSTNPNADFAKDSKGAACPKAAVPSTMPTCSVFEAGYRAEAGSGLEPKVLRTLPMTKAANTWLHDHHALPLLSGDQPQTIPAAFHSFRLVNDQSIQLTGHASKNALYNMACCLAVACEAQIAQYRKFDPTATSVTALSRSPSEAGGVVAKGMPPECPTKDNTVRSLVEARLDAAVVFLKMAAAAGYHDRRHCSSDPDLRVVKECKPDAFQETLRLMTN